MMNNREENMNEHMTADGYMKNTHPDAFLDYPEKREAPINAYECPTCKGHGGWNLKLNQYCDDIPAHRHFRCCCSTCNGFGYTYTKNQCEHKWTYERSEAMCLHRYKCEKCGVESLVDSSD